MQSKLVVCVLLGIGLVACLYMMWTIAFRLRSHMVSISYKFIFAAKVCWAILTASGIYLIIFPPHIRQLWLQLSWFSVLSMGCIFSAIGFHLYSRDVQAVLESEGFTDPLPAVPPTTTNDTHKSEPPDHKEV